MLLWPGGIWNWFDPLTVIDAVAELARRRDDVRLFFLGLRHPNPHVAGDGSGAAGRRTCRGSSDCADRVVFFNEDWVPYEQRGAYLLEADLGVSAHFDDLESRFAFRTRLLDCFWAGLPVVTTSGDSLGDLVERRGLGRTVPPRRRRRVGRRARVAARRRAARTNARARAIAGGARRVPLAARRRAAAAAGADWRARRSRVGARRRPRASWIVWRVRHAVADSRSRRRDAAARHSSHCGRAAEALGTLGARERRIDRHRAAAAALGADGSCSSFASCA